ncbi:MAG: NAD(P)/FAD-dependent oxidoreductase [Halobacteria archaeon]|nr:NAD(P)/FAD-dependent oxidoreductase [Halobacteria archaeon]
MAPKPRAVVVGAGIGGLSAGAKLAREGFEVEIFEKNYEIGGRFRNLEYEGYELTSGALHMIPHGATGPLGRILDDVGADVDIVECDPAAKIRFGDSRDDVLMSEYVFGKYGLVKNALWYLRAWYGLVRGRNLDDITSGEMRDVADAFCGWSCSLTAEEMPVDEIYAIMKNTKKYGMPGVPKGGCSGVVDALADVVESEGGEIHTRHEVEAIDEGEVTVEGETVEADYVISNAGHRITARLMGDDDYLEEAESRPPSPGIKMSLGTDEPLLGYNGILFAPEAEKVDGINEVTHADPSLAPDGKHLTEAHMSWNPERETAGEAIRKAKSDLEEIFPDADYEILLSQGYKGDWPVNRVANGYKAGNDTPLDGVYVVGDAAKGKGGIEVEGIAMGVNDVVEEITATT